jgi:NADPH:quinone reductase-like Zn-dependent oxidoreductase
MRAMTVTGADGSPVLTPGEVEAPERDGAELLVKVVAAGVDARDAAVRSGVPGGSFSGIVVEAPYAAHPLQPGTEVFGVSLAPHAPGSYAELVAVSSLSVAKRPATLSHVEAAGAPLASLTAWGMAVETARAHDGQRILVHGGAGGAGHLAVQFAAYFGAHVVATGRGDDLAWLRELGAAVVVDVDETPVEDAIDPVDVVIDLADARGGSRGASGAGALAALRPGGLLVTEGPGWPGMVEDAAAHGARATGYRVAPDGATLAVVARLLESGDVRVYVDEVLDLTDAEVAQRRLAEGGTRGMLVLKVCEG